MVVTNCLCSIKQSAALHLMADRGAGGGGGIVKQHLLTALLLARFVCADADDDFSMALCRWGCWRQMLLAQDVSHNRCIDDWTKMDTSQRCRSGCPGQQLLFCLRLHTTPVHALDCRAISR